MGDGWIALAWMMPLYGAIVLPGIVVAHALIRSRPTVLQVVVWLTAPVTAWWICTAAIDRWLALLNVLVEPPLLAGIAAASYLWASLSAANGPRARRQNVALFFVLFAATLMGLLFPSLGASP